MLLGLNPDARRAEITCPASVKEGSRDEKEGRIIFEAVCFSRARCYHSAFCFRGMFMAEAPVGDVPDHRPQGFYAGSTAMNLKERVCALKGLALTEWPLPARYGRRWAGRRNNLNGSSRAPPGRIFQMWRQSCCRVAAHG